MNKTLSRSLAFLMILSALLTAGCQEKIDDETAVTGGQTDAVTDAETELSDDLPEEDFGGAIIRTAIYPGPEQNYDMITEESADLLEDKVYQRNRAVEERFGIQFEVFTTNDTNQLHNAVASDSEDWQLLFFPICYSISLANQGDFLSTDNLPYLNLDKPWWDARLTEDLSINGNLFFISGDISPSSLNMSSALLFNKDLFDNLNMTYPYQTVSDGSWTLDALSALLKNSNADLNGDGRMTTDSNSSDRFGLTGWMWSIPNGLFYSAGGKFVGRDENNMPILDFNAEKTVDIFEKIYNVIIDQESYFAVNTGEEYNNTFAVFTSNRSLMLDVKLYDLSKLRDMDADFGVLPLPKYDEQQEDYITFVNDASNMVSVPKTLRDPEMLSIILEGMASESYKNLTPDFKEYVLKGKYPRDIESTDMVELIIRNRVFDIAYIYDLPTYGDFVRPLLMSKSKNVASTLESARRGAEKSLDKLVAIFDEE